MLHALSEPPQLSFNCLFCPLQPLSYAADKGYIPLICLLVKAGADPKTTNVQLETPASLAYANGHTAAADWLEAVVALKKGGLTSDLPPHPLFENGSSNSRCVRTCTVLIRESGHLIAITVCILVIPLCSIHSGPLAYSIGY